MHSVAVKYQATRLYLQEHFWNKRLGTQHPRRLRRAKISLMPCDL